MLGFNFFAIVLKRRRRSFMLETWHLWLEIDSWVLNPHQSRKPFSFLWQKKGRNMRNNMRNTNHIFSYYNFHLHKLTQIYTCEEGCKKDFLGKKDCHADFQRDVHQLLTKLKPSFLVRYKINSFMEI